MKKYSLWTTYSIDIALDWLSEDDLIRLEKLVEDVVENILCEKIKLEYFELVLDKTNWDKLYRLRAK